MNQINSKKSKSIKEENNSGNLITSLDDDYFSEEEIKDNLKKNNYENLYQIFEIQLNPEFFDKKEKSNEILKISSKKFVTHKKSIFAPSNINLEKLENLKKEKFGKNINLKKNYLLSNSSKRNSNSSKRNSYDYSENFIKKKLKEFSMITFSEKKENSNLLVFSEKKKNSKILFSEKNKNSEISDNSEKRVNSDFSEIENIIKKKTDKKNISLIKSSKNNSLEKSFSEKEEKEKNFLFKIKKNKSSSVKKKKIKNKFKNNSFNEIPNCNKNIINENYSNISISNSLNINEKKNCDNFCFLCEKAFFPKNIVVKFFLCEDIFHKNCLDTFLNGSKGFAVVCPKCKKFIYK